MATASEPVLGEGGPPTQAARRFYRSNSQRVVAGICGGLGEYFAVDPVWFRLGFVVLALGGGSGILIYLLMWLIVPPTPAGYAPPETGRGTVTGATIVGVILVIVGTSALVNTVAPWLGQYIWPLVFVLGGMALLPGRSEP